MPYFAYAMVDMIILVIILDESLRESTLGYGLPGTCPACGGHFFARTGRATRADQQASGLSIWHTVWIHIFFA